MPEKFAKSLAGLLKGKDVTVDLHRNSIIIRPFDVRNLDLLKGISGDLRQMRLAINNEAPTYQIREHTDELPELHITHSNAQMIKKIFGHYVAFSQKKEKTPRGVQGKDDDFYDHGY